MEKPRGRAALKEALLRTLRRPGDGDAASASPLTGTVAPVQGVGVMPPEPPQDPPKPRGRAELFKKLKQRVTTPSTEPTAPTTSTVAKESPVVKQLQELQIQEKPFVKSPKGTSGTQIGIIANYIRLTRQEEKGFHKYEVKFSPPIDARIARFKLIKANIAEMGNVHMFNGSNDLYLPIVLPKASTEFNTPHPFDPETIVTLTVIYKRQEPFGSRESLQFLNILFKRIMNTLKMKAIGRNYYNHSAAKYIPQYALEVIPGYAVAVDAMEGGLMVCLDTCHKLMRKKSVLEILLELYRDYPKNFKEKATSELVGQVIITGYNQENYIVDDIVWELNPTETFETKSGTITFVEYFKKRHGVEITNMTQPLLVNFKKKKTSDGKVEEMKLCLIPELCNITGISQDMMTHKFRKDIAMYTKLAPAKRFEVLQTYIRNVKTNPEAAKMLADWGFAIDDGVIDINARVLTDNKIAFGRQGDRKIDLLNCTDWARHLQRENLIQPIDMVTWLVIYPESARGVTEKFIQKMCGLSRGFGCRINAPRFVSLPGRGTDADYRRALDENANDNVQIIFLVAPMARESLYQAIKSTTLCRKGILTQVALVKTLSNEKIVSSVALKIGVQMQAKLGGSLWAMVFPNLCKDFMFCGIDTYHSKGSKKSVGALVCSIDEQHTRYYTGLAFQAHEIADALKLHFQAAMEARKRMTGRYPSVIYVVRDGVGDGALQHVADYELKQYLSVAQETKTNFKMCFIVIQKRINTRFSLPGKTNPPPGTVVDHTITRRQYDDFYLVPQSSREGTVSPCHYIVLHNDSPDLNLDRMQKLSFKLCHLYYNWTGAVSVPAPCQYAHKAAYLAGQYLEKQPDESLNELLYYL